MGPLCRGKGNKEVNNIIRFLLLILLIVRCDRNRKQQKRRRRKRREKKLKPSGGLYLVLRGDPLVRLKARPPETYGA